MTHCLVISGDTINSHMGGVGVRYWELAHALAQHVQVTLALPGGTDLTSDQVHLLPFDLEKGDLRQAAQAADVIAVHGFVLHFHPYLRQLGLPLAVDLYVPFLLESLVWHDQDDWQTWIPAYEEYLRVQGELLRAGDFFFCASERQRDYWLGFLHANNRINPHTYRQDPSLRQLIDVVPFGLPPGIPQANGPVLKGVHPGIQAGDKVILWSGGLWDWLDPLSLIRAMKELASRHADLKLYFMGTRHPNPVVSGMAMPERAIALSKELGLYGSSVFFGDWTPYDARQAYLAEADLAVVSHPNHIETHFSFRTRVLDCIWAGLPVITTEGDAMADWVRSEGIGLTVPPEDASALAAAIETVLSRGGRAAYAPAFTHLRESLRWEQVVLPLARFCQSPSPSPDKGQYLTEAERIANDKDAFLQQVIHDKDAFLEQVVRDKDAYCEEINASLRRENTRLSEALESYRSMLPLRVYHKLRSIVRR